MKKICFIHIPKCGGTSIRASMNSKLNLIKRDKVDLNHPASAIAAQHLGLDILSFREYLLNYFLAIEKNTNVMGHFKCTAATRERFQHEWQFITLIREPVSRWYSHYFFDRFREKNLKYKKTDLDLASYLDSEEGAQNARLYTRHFSDFVNSRDQINWDYVNQAVANIKGFSVYGVLEDLEAFAGQYKESIGVKLQIPYKNKNPKKNYRKQEISNELQERVLDLCKYDTTIYEQVKESLVPA